MRWQDIDVTDETATLYVYNANILVGKRILIIDVTDKTATKPLAVMQMYLSVVLKNLLM